MEYTDIDLTASTQTIVNFMNRQFHFCQRVLPSTDLIAGSFLDSMSYKVLAAYLEEHFEITLSGDDMTEDHFRTPENIARLVHEKQQDSVSVF